MAQLEQRQLSHDKHTHDTQPSHIEHTTHKTHNAQKQKGQEKQATEQREQAQKQHEELRNSPMMAHLLDALEQGTDIGHYGRLTFVKVTTQLLSLFCIISIT